MSNITVTTFKWVPPFAQGLVRDLRVRWALEEAGLPYREKLLDPGEQSSPAYRSRQPSRQVRVFDQTGLVMFESGPILMHIAERAPGLLPAGAAGRARVRTWM